MCSSLFLLLLPLLAVSGEGVGGEQPCVPGNGLIPMEMKIPVGRGISYLQPGRICRQLSQGNQEQTPALSHIHLWCLPGQVQPFPPVIHNQAIP